jgi:hypothetical protein
MASSHLALRLMLSAALVAALGCRTFAGPTAPPGTSTSETMSLTEIAAEIQLHLRDDTYRYGRALAYDGANVFAAALWRLDDLQRRRARPPERWENVDLVIEFARARALERLRRYGEARRAYARVATVPSALQAAACEASAVMERLAAHAAPPRVAFATAEDELRFLDARVDAWRTLAWDYRDSLWGTLAREEAEAAEVLRVEWLARHATPEVAIRAGERLVERHQASKLHAAHLIRLGDLYAAAARREYLRSRAQISRFDAERYEQWLDRAFSAYELAGEERVPAVRREAQKKIEALLAYHEGIRGHVP